MPAHSDDRYEPLPGLLGMPAFLLGKLGRRAQVTLLICILALLAVTVIFIVPSVWHARRQAALSERRAHSAAVVQERRRLTEDQRPRRARVTSRAAAAGELDHAITRDARARIRRGALSGPQVRQTRCQRSPGPTTDAAGRRSDGRRFDCLAMSSRALGFEFIGVVDDRRLRATWCKTNGVGLTDGPPLATVALERACSTVSG